MNTQLVPRLNAASPESEEGVFGNRGVQLPLNQFFAIQADAECPDVMSREGFAFVVPALSGFHRMLHKDAYAGNFALSQCANLDEIIDVVIRVPRLRLPVPPELPALLTGCVVAGVRRRGKYLLLDCARKGVVQGCLILHLGMSGNLRFVPQGTPVEKHDHFDLVLAGQILRFADPRRFGVIAWQAGLPEAAALHPLISVLGVEPLSEAFTVDWFHQAIFRRSSPIKPVLMDGHLVVGVGNIYASESPVLAA